MHSQNSYNVQANYMHIKSSFHYPEDDLCIGRILYAYTFVRNVRDSKFNKMYMELCKELSPFIGISVTEIYKCAY